MLNAVVIENKNRNTKALDNYLANVVPGLCVKAKLGSVKESIEYFSEGHEIDIVFSDVQLPDGLSFDIFAQTIVHIPVIFITAYKNYIMMEFENNGIDKSSALNKKDDIWKVILQDNGHQTHFLKNTDGILDLDKSFAKKSRKKKTRLIVKRGVANIALLLTDVAVIYTKNKLIYVVDREAKSYSIDKTLTELEEELDDDMFFRVNRQIIININFARSFKSYQKVKLLIDIDIPGFKDLIIVSQNMAPIFKKWMNDA